MTSPTNHQNRQPAEGHAYGEGNVPSHLDKRSIRLTNNEEPDSQAGDELDKILDAYDKSPEYLRSMTKAAVIAYAERLATKRAVETMKEIREWFTKTFETGGPPWANDSSQAQYEAMMELLDEHIATLTKETEHHE